MEPISSNDQITWQAREVLTRPEKIKSAQFLKFIIHDRHYISVLIDFISILSSFHFIYTSLSLIANVILFEQSHLP
jgi:hypothetical protein